jgi:LacI family transcriptional regulator
VTLQDVAKAAMVSPTTASYILNGRSAEMRISADAEVRVRQAAERLGYRPNRSAQNLRTATTRTIGLISDSVASGHYANNMLRGASAEAGERGHLLLISETGGDPKTERDVLDEMLDRQVDGLIYATLVTLEIDPPLLPEVPPVVLLNCTVLGDTTRRSVLPDEHGGGRTAARLLLDAGYGERVDVIGLDPNLRALAGPARFRGIVDELVERGLPKPTVVATDWDVVEARTAVGSWLREGARPEAVICLNDRIAMGALQAFESAGLRVPDDVSLVSFDGSELAGWLRPRITSVTIPYTRLGEVAARMVLAPDEFDSAQQLVAMPVLEGDSVRVRTP